MVCLPVVSSGEDPRGGDPPRDLWVATMRETVDDGTGTKPVLFRLQTVKLHVACMLLGGQISFVSIGV